MNMFDIAKTIGSIASAVPGGQIVGGALNAIGGVGSFIDGVFQDSSGMSWNTRKRIMDYTLDQQKDMTKFQGDVGLQNSKDLVSFQNQQTLDMAKQGGAIQLKNMQDMGLNPAMSGGQPQTLASSSASQSAPSGQLSFNPVDAMFRAKELQIQDKLANSTISKTAAEISNLIKQNEKITSDIGVNDSNITLNYAQKYGLDLNNQFAQETLVERMRQQNLINENLYNDILNKVKQGNLMDAQTFTAYLNGYLSESQKNLIEKEIANYDRQADDAHNESVQRQQNLESSTSVNKSQVKVNESQVALNHSQINLNATNAEQMRANIERIKQLTPHEKYLIQKQASVEYAKIGLTYNQAEYISRLALNADSERALVQAQKEATEMGTTLAPINTAIGAFSAGASGYQSIKTGQFLDGKTSGVRPQIGFNVQ